MRRRTVGASGHMLAGLLTVGLVGCVSAGTRFPERVLDPEVVGVVVEDRNVEGTRHIYVMDDGSEVEIGTPATELAGSGLGQDRLLVVARDGDANYYLALPREERMTTDPNCYGLYAASAAWDTPDGIVLRFASADIGLRLPAAALFSPAVAGEDGRIRRSEQFCITPDGQVHAPDG